MTKTRHEDVGRLGKLSNRLYFNNSVGPNRHMFYSSSDFACWFRSNGIFFFLGQVVIYVLYYNLGFHQNIDLMILCCTFYIFAIV